MKKKQLFLAIQAAIFTFAVGNVTAVENATESVSNGFVDEPDEVIGEPVATLFTEELVVPSEEPTPIVEETVESAGEPEPAPITGTEPLPAEEPAPIAEEGELEPVVTDESVVTEDLPVVEPVLIAEESAESTEESEPVVTDESVVTEDLPVVEPVLIAEESAESTEESEPVVTDETVATEELPAEELAPVTEETAESTEESEPVAIDETVATEELPAEETTPVTEETAESTEESEPVVTDEMVATEELPAEEAVTDAEEVVATTEVEVNFSEETSVAQSNAIVVGTHTCGRDKEDRNTVLLLSPEGELLHSFGVPEFDSRGIYLTTPDFDADGLNDVAVNEIGQGTDVLIFDTSKKHLGSVLTNGDDDGVHVAFGDMNGDSALEIVVTNQERDNQINFFDFQGTAIRPVLITDDKVKLDVAAGDVNGDGLDEIVLVIAEKVRKAHHKDVFLFDHNVFVFNEEGYLLNSFEAELDKRGNKLSGLVVALGDVNGDGDEEIILGNASKGFGHTVAVYEDDGTLLNEFKTSSKRVDDEEDNDDDDEDSDDDSDDGDEDENEGDTRSRGCKTFKGHGVVLTAGDVNDDGNAEIIVARSGGKEIRIYESEGGLIEKIKLYQHRENRNQVITDLAFGDEMGVEIPLVEELPPEGEALENITVVGTSEEPVVIENREIQGTVRLSFATIVNININMGAHLILGPGVHFRHHSAIPAGLRLTTIFKTISQTVVSIEGEEVEQEVAALDLSESVVEDAPPVLEDIQVILNEGNEGASTALTQDPETGHLEVDVGDTHYEIVPTEIVQAEEDAVPGVHFNDEDGTVRFITHRRQEIIAHSVVQSMTHFISGLSNIGLFKLSVDMRGLMSAIDLTNNIRYCGRSEFSSESVDESAPEGVYSVESSFVNFVFKKNSMKRRQVIYPAPVDLDALISEDTNADNVAVQANGVVSFTLTGITYQGTLSYDVIAGETPESGGVEFVAGEDGNFTIIYPNGDRQSLSIISNVTEEVTDATAEPIVTDEVATEEVTETVDESVVTDEVATEEVTETVDEPVVTDEVVTEEVTETVDEPVVTDEVATEEVTETVDEPVVTDEVVTEEVAETTVEPAPVVTDEVVTEEVTETTPEPVVTNEVATEEVAETTTEPAPVVTDEVVVEEVTETTAEPVAPVIEEVIEVAEESVTQ